MCLLLWKFGYFSYGYMNIGDRKIVDKDQFVIEGIVYGEIMRDIIGLGGLYLLEN